MTKKLNYKILRQTYILTYIFAVLTRVIIPFAQLESNAVNSIIFAFTALFGCVVIAYDFFTNKVFKNAKWKIFLIIFLIVCMISSLINYKFGILGNIRNIVWLSISFFLLYPVDFNRTKEDIISEIRFISKSFIIIWNCALIFSIGMFLFDVGYYLDYDPTKTTRQGFIESRLFGIFEDPNFAAITCIVVFILALFLFKKSKTRFQKSFYVFSMCLDYIYMVLSGSRTAIVAASVTMFFSAFFLIQKKFKKITSIAIALSATLALFFSFKTTQVVLSYTPKLTYLMGSKNGTIQKFHARNFHRIDDNENFSNNRFKIWTAAIEIFKTKPILGTSPRNMRQYAKECLPGNFIGIRGYAVHNAYIDVLVSTGIIGALAIICFFFNYLKYILIFLFRKFNDKNYSLLIMCLSIVLCIATSACFLSDIFFSCSFGTLFFWLFLGYSLFFAKEEGELI